MSETITASLTVSGGDVITVNLNTLARGPEGPAGSGTNAITSATTSDGTADLLLANVETATAEVTGTLIAPHIHGNLAGSVYAHVRAGEALEKGDPVYVSGSHGSGVDLIAEVSKADASNAAKMPAVGIMDADVARHANGHMVITGTITELDTAGLAINAELYVASGGGMTATPPTARAQPVARVERANANNGAILVKVNGLSASDATASTLVRRTSDGNASFAGLNATELAVGGSIFQASSLGNVSFGSGAVVNFDALTYNYALGGAAASAHRTALGLGTGNSPTFSGVILGTAPFPPFVSTDGTTSGNTAGVRLGVGARNVLRASYNYGVITFGGTSAAFQNFGYHWVNGDATGNDTNVRLSLTFGGNDILEQKRLGNPQAFRLYNTYSSATNFERLNFRWSGNTAFIGTEKGSASPGGTARDLVLETDGTSRAKFAAGENSIEMIGPSSSIILASPDGNRWRVTVDNTGALTTTSLA